MGKGKAAKVVVRGRPEVERKFAGLARRLEKMDQPTDETRREKGLKRLAEIVGVDGAQVLNRLLEFSPDLTRFIVDFAYGDVISRERLDDRTRALAVIAALAAQGSAQPQLRTHIGSALNSGCTREEILEVLLLVAVYAGFPAALNGMGVARDVFDGRARRVRAKKRKSRSA